MNHLLFDRSTGTLRPKAFAKICLSQRLHSIQLAPRLHFNGGEKKIPVEAGAAGTGTPLPGGTSEAKIWAHQAGVNALGIDIEGKILVSGGADSSIKLWDLGECTGSNGVLRPNSTVSRTDSAHKFGITHLSFYPFDSAAFLSSSYDHHLKFYATETLAISADFDLDCVVYTHALSPMADHLLVACATQHPAVRLIDLRSGSSTHSLAGHHGAVLSLAWSPTLQNILASGGIDGKVRLWDVRKSSASLGVLDLEDSMGITGTNGLGRSARSRESGKSHDGAVNALMWSDDGAYLISSGHDDRIRVWDVAIGSNTLASFGPTIKNSHLSTLPLLVSPTAYTPFRKEILFYPNENELLMFELHEGRLLKRLKVPGPSVAAVRSRTGERNIRNKITSLVWRGQADAIISGHTDGQVRAWTPQSAEDNHLDREEEQSMKRPADDEEEGSMRKRQVLNDVFRDLTKQKITFR